MKPMDLIDRIIWIVLVLSLIFLTYVIHYK